jgi:hypothetical protein
VVDAGGALAVELGGVYVPDGEGPEDGNGAGAGVDEFVAVEFAIGCMGGMGPVELEDEFEGSGAQVEFAAHTVPFTHW